MDGGKSIPMASLCSARLSPDALGFIPPKKMASSIHDSRSRVHGSSSRYRMGRRANNNNQLQVVAMAPEEEKLTRRNPLDFPIVSFPSIRRCLGIKEELGFKVSLLLVQLLCHGYVIATFEQFV